jgi:hypothetical protein
MQHATTSRHCALQDGIKKAFNRPCHGDCSKHSALSQEAQSMGPYMGGSDLATTVGHTEAHRGKALA